MLSYVTITDPTEKASHMEFRANQVSARFNREAEWYFTEKLSEPEAGKELFSEVLDRLGNAAESLPDWHPVLTAPSSSLPSRGIFGNIPIYSGCDHTRFFIRGILTCPYSETKAEKMVDAVNLIFGLHAKRLDGCLYTDSAVPVLIEACDVSLEADGTIRSRDALTWFIQNTVGFIPEAQVAETWWNIRSGTLGAPHGSRSSLFVNSHAGQHMRKILEALNSSGVFGPVMEKSLGMLSERKRGMIARAAAGRAESRGTA